MDITNKKLIFNFDKDKFSFNQHFSDLLDKNSQGLSNLHSILDRSKLPTEIISVDDDQSQSVYDLLYTIDAGYALKDNSDGARGAFLRLFDDFVHYIAREIFKEDLVYQNRPTLRVCFPGNKAVGDWHRDRDYNHPVEEVNIWVPITNACGSNSIWIESSFDKEDYLPVDIDFGNFIIFDSGLKHGNVVNEEGITRISFDFRVIPKSAYKAPSEASLSYSQGIEFKLGDYYSVTSI
jgi:hypothetical protein